MDTALPNQMALRTPTSYVLMNLLDAAYDRVPYGAEASLYYIIITILNGKSRSSLVEWISSHA